MRPMTMPGACGGKKKVRDPLELELQTDMSCRVDAGNQSRVLCKSSKCS